MSHAPASIREPPVAVPDPPEQRQAQPLAPSLEAGLTPAVLQSLQRTAGNALVAGYMAARQAAGPGLRRCACGGIAGPDGECQQCRRRRLTGNGSQSVSPQTLAPMLLRLTPAEFRKDLGATPGQKSAIDALFTNKTFAALWSYLETCPATAKGDLGPLKLKVTPGLKIRGAERYGGYNPVTRTLEINPTKAEHKSNPTELVDTIVHELIHAVHDLEPDCKKATGKAAPLGGAATESPPERADVTAAEEKKLMEELGPGASNPCEEFIDINKAAQRMIIDVLRHNIKVANVGKPTITFVNEILRRDPKAMAAYTKCRDAACAKQDPDRGKAMAACSADILNNYMPKNLKA